MEGVRAEALGSRSRYSFTLPTREHASWANSERAPCEFMRGLEWLVRNPGRIGLRQKYAGGQKDHVGDAFCSYSAL